MIDWVERNLLLLKAKASMNSLDSSLPSRLLLLPSTQVAQAEAESAFGLARLARSFAISPRQSLETKFFNPSLTFFLGLCFPTTSS